MHHIQLVNPYGEGFSMGQPRPPKGWGPVHPNFWDPTYYLVWPSATKFHRMTKLDKRRENYLQGA